jgi:glucose/arabinose dehydrogenase
MAVGWLGATLLAATACGDRRTAAKDAPPGPDDVPGATIDAPIDAPTLPACANPVSGSTVTLRKINEIPNNITGIATLATAPPNDPRLFVLDIDGVIQIFKDEVLGPQPFIDLSVDSGGPVVTGNEMGLLGLAFHPQYATNGEFFVYYVTGPLGALRDVVARCRVSPTDPDRAEAATCIEVLSIPDPAVNHNGGMIEFGSDGYLYIGTGDGGGNSNEGRSQDLSLLLGKMLRIDIDHPAPGKQYGIPADNPYAAGGGAPEIFMLGLRNPWRWSFDRGTGDLWIGDVGKASIEELDVLTPAQQNGANLGWSIYEGSRCNTPPCDPAGKVFPLDQRERAATGWAAIVAGQVYRGTCYPDLVGWHFYSDDTVGGLAKARLRPDGTLEVVDLTGVFPRRPVSLHADARGELYMTDVSGFVYHLEAGP